MADRATEIGPGGGAFPTTQWSRILKARDDSDPAWRDGLQQILRQYWKPVYVYIRRAWGKSNEDAKDLTQGFFVEVLENDLLARYAPQRGRFRTFLKTALRHFLVDERRSGQRQKRGGGRSPVALDEDLRPLEEIAAAPGDATPEACFDRAWANALLADALSDLERALKAENREDAFRALELYDLAPPPGEAPGYKDIARQTGRSEADVKADLAFARLRLRQALMERIRQYVADEAEAFSELKEILGP